MPPAPVPKRSELDAVRRTARAAAAAVAARNDAIVAARAANIPLRTIADATDGELTHAGVAKIVARKRGNASP